MYDFHKWQELAWAIFVAVATVVLTELVTFNESTLDDPIAWGTALVAACVRAAAGAALAFIRPAGSSAPDEAP
ncbi:MAG TPA: hypothetical protein VFH63_04030 [candidate division Zixibacteria bacterium]|nr:hypothetical protein [candidate division Zixibacteria bacterium]